MSRVIILVIFCSPVFNACEAARNRNSEGPVCAPMGLHSQAGLSLGRLALELGLHLRALREGRMTRRFNFSTKPTPPALWLLSLAVRVVVLIPCLLLSGRRTLEDVR